MITNLKLTRVSLGLSQATLAKKTGIKRWKISLAEANGGLFSSAELKSLCSFLKQSPETLFKIIPPIKDEKFISKKNLLVSAANKAISEKLGF